MNFEMTKKQNKLLYQSFNEVWNKEKLWRGINLLPPATGKAAAAEEAARSQTTAAESEASLDGYQGEMSASRHPERLGTKAQDIPETIISTKSLSSVAHA